MEKKNVVIFICIKFRGVKRTKNFFFEFSAETLFLRILDDFKTLATTKINSDNLVRVHTKKRLKSYKKELGHASQCPFDTSVSKFRR